MCWITGLAVWLVVLTACSQSLLSCLGNRNSNIIQEQEWCAELQRLQRDKVDEPQHEAVGKSCWSQVKERGDDRRAAAWLRALQMGCLLWERRWWSAEKKRSHGVFVDPEKARDRVPREKLACEGGAGHVARCAVGMADGCKVRGERSFLFTSLYSFLFF